MKVAFKMSDLGTLSYFFDLEFVQTSYGVLLHEKKYAYEVLKKFNIMNCNSAPVPVMMNLKLIEELNEKIVDVTLLKHIVGSLKVSLQQ